VLLQIEHSQCEIFVFNKIFRFFIIDNSDFAIPTWYTYADEPQDASLPLFSIDHDLDPVQGIIPFVQRAFKAADKPIRLEATMDYPPSWMLNTSTPLPGADINSTYFSSLANYYYKYAEAMAVNGVPVEFLSLFNELTDSYTNASFENTR
jgi:O-glycosyl hydrolase